MANPDKTRETRLRRMAERQGLAVVKSRRRDPLAKDYGLYWVIDPALGPEPGDSPVPGGGAPAYHFPFSGLELDEVEDWLRTRPEDR